ncbi:LysR family transcriptional regulator [Anaeromassilibacillus senegalensis]|uniref:LysR family transcriptional regulator n=1 Tax=Anaeromassilibacillus senegalensis TaxID=1673717 RepID=A0ABS9CJ00_9FIRM|nr:LysR family transcriptional regulator [Anaeromassilibacillus senegalensis]MCF2651125.1 LysR family transcriptional regulator [Anaeromassilibacillus senegalensis]
MELRVLRYFLAVAREESISEAANFLHITQPTLSRQIMELEEELGTKLLNRGRRNQKITLTDEGMLLRRRAEEMIELADRTEAEFARRDELISGEIHIGAGETDAMRLLTRAAKTLHTLYPHIRYHLYSGNAEYVTEQLDRGLLDFGILVEPADVHKYDYIRLPATDIWGVLLRRDHPLAARDAIQPADLRNLPLIISRQTMVQNELAGWLGSSFDTLHVVATYNLLYNASLMVEEGLGCALCLDKIINTTGDSRLCFRPLAPKLTVGLNVVWKKHQVFPKAAELFLQKLREMNTI